MSACWWPAITRSGLKKPDARKPASSASTCWMKAEFIWTPRQWFDPVRALAPGPDPTDPVVWAFHASLSGPVAPITHPAITAIKAFQRLSISGSPDRLCNEGTPQGAQEQRMDFV